MRTFFIVTLLVIFLGLLVPVAPVAANADSGSFLLILTNQGQGAFPAEIRLAPILRSLQAHKQITQYEWMPDVNAFRVEGFGPATAQMLGALTGVSRMVPANATNLETARQAQRGASMNVGGARALIFKQTTSTTEDPNFNVHETWDMFQAKGLASGQAVTAVLKNSGGGIKTTLNLTADGGGAIQAPFKTDVVQGDYVEITYNSTTRTIHSDAITIDFDFTNNHLTGTAGANRNLWVNFGDDGTGWCERHDYTVSTLTNGAGNYDVDTSGNYDVVRRTEVNVMSENEDGNGWTVWKHAPWLLLHTQLNATNGNGNGLAPDEDVDLVLKTGATEKEHNTSHTNSPDANFGFGFWGADMLPGDTLTVTEKGNTWATINIVPLSVTMNPATGKIIGQAPAGKKVAVRSSHFDTATGQWSSPACQYPTAGATGKFTTTMAVPYIGGDTVGVFYVDDNGFEQQVWDTVPNLYVYQGLNLAQGTMHTNFDGEVDITVVNKLGATKYHGTGYAFGGWWSQILAQNGAPVNLAVKDKITVTARAGTLAAEANNPITATVTKIAAALDPVKNQVSGTAPKNAHLWFTAQLWDGKGFNCRGECNKPGITDANGAFKYDFNDDPVNGDYADVSFVDAQGNQTVKRAFSTTPTITMNSSPSTFRRGRQNTVKYTIANGQHVQDTGILADSSSRPDWRYTLQNGPDGNWWPGGPGQYTVNVGLSFQGKVYFRAYAQVDGRYIATNPELVAKAR